MGNSDRMDFLRFIEESGINALLMTAICELNELPIKPDNPIEWLRKFFRRDAPNQYDELEKQKAELKEEILKKESKLRIMRAEEKKKIQQLNRLQQKTLSLAITGNIPNSADLDKDVYKDCIENDMWRIQPDPFFRTSCSASRLFGIQENFKLKGGEVDLGLLDEKGDKDNDPHVELSGIKEGSNDSESESENAVRKFINEKHKMHRDSHLDDDDQRRGHSRKKDKKKDIINVNIKDKSPHSNKRMKRMGTTKSRLGSISVQASRFVEELSPQQSLVAKSDDPVTLTDPVPLVNIEEVNRSVIEGDKDMNVQETEPVQAPANNDEQKPKKRPDKDFKKGKSRILEAGKQPSEFKTKQKKGKDKKAKQIEEVEEAEESPEVISPATDPKMLSPIIKGSKPLRESPGPTVAKIRFDMPQAYFEQHMENIPSDYWKSSFSTAFDPDETSSDEDLDLPFTNPGTGTSDLVADPVTKLHQKSYNSKIISENTWQLQMEKDRYNDEYDTDLGTNEEAQDEKPQGDNNPFIIEDRKSMI